MVSTDFGRYARCKQKLAELRFKKQLARDAAAQPCRGRLGISTALFDAISKFKPFIYCMKIYEISFFDARQGSKSSIRICQIVGAFVLMFIRTAMRVQDALLLIGIGAPS